MKVVDTGEITDYFCHFYTVTLHCKMSIQLVDILDTLKTKYFHESPQQQNDHESKSRRWTKSTVQWSVSWSNNQNKRINILKFLPINFSSNPLQ